MARLAKNNILARKLYFMKKNFIKRKALKNTVFEWGEATMLCYPAQNDCQSIVVMEVTLKAGHKHDFHKHDTQDEMITVISGKIVQWLEQEYQVLEAGDSVYIPKNTIHGSFNEFNEPAILSVVLGPAVGEIGYQSTDVSNLEPWQSMRHETKYK